MMETRKGEKGQSYTSLHSEQTYQRRSGAESLEALMDSRVISTFIKDSGPVSHVWALNWVLFSCFHGEDRGFSCPLLLSALKYKTAYFLATY